MFHVIAASSYRVNGSGGVIPPTGELDIIILTPTEGQTVTLPSKTIFSIEGATDIIIVQPTEGETVTLPSKTKIRIE